MAAQETTSPPVTPDEVAQHRSSSRWSVEESAWKQVLPELPDEVIALLATPVVVSAESLAALARPRQAPERRGVGGGDPKPRFLAPSGQEFGGEFGEEFPGVRHSTYVS